MLEAWRSCCDSRRHASRRPASPPRFVGGRAPIARRVVDTSRHARARTSRRSFLVRSAVVGSALAVNPWRFVFQPGTAYESRVRSRSELLVGLDSVLLLDQQRPELVPAGNRFPRAGGRPINRASATAGRATSSTATPRVGRAAAARAASARPVATRAAVTAAPDRATSASCVATSSATANATRSSRASGRWSAGSRCAGRRGSSIRRVPRRARRPTRPHCTPHPVWKRNP